MLSGVPGSLRCRGDPGCAAPLSGRYTPAVLKLELADGISTVDAAAWDTLVADPSPTPSASSPGSNPFVEHAFLALLESSGSVGGRTGWLPAPVLVYDGPRLVGAAPAYVRGDSYGEYVFDWGWAEAAARARIPYYPKITVAVPFTPATGPRLLVHPEADRAAVTAQLVRGLRALAGEHQASGIHTLCCLDRDAAALEAAGHLRRTTHQYHWRNDGYRDFEHFLSALRSEARKQIRKERRRIGEQGVTVVLKQGLEVTADDWALLDRLYRVHSSGKWGRPYLTPQFFAQARATIGHRAVVALAERGGQIIAGTLSLQRGSALYGRYWGALEQVDGLHFELCYYALIEHAIATEKHLFEAGAQGEHKLKRGFVPVAIHSAHHLEHPELRGAVARFLADERRAVTEALPEWAEHVPFRAGAAPDFPQVAGVDVGRAADEE